MGRRLIFVLFLFLAAPVFSQTQLPVRTVTVRVIIDWDRQTPAPEEYVKQAVEFTNKEMERKNFGIALRIASVEVRRDMWPEKTEMDIRFAGVDVQNLALQDKGNADILLAYTPRILLQEVSEQIDGEYQLGWRKLLGCTGDPGRVDFALIKTGDWIGITTLHEAYHLFGALDIPESVNKKSIMRNPQDGAYIDAENAAIVRKNRLRTF